MKSTPKVTVGRNENQEFQIDPVARFNILSGMSSMTLSVCTFFYPRLDGLIQGRLDKEDKGYAFTGHL